VKIDAIEAQLAERGIELIRPARRNERPRRGARQFKPLRQIIESINATLKTQPGTPRRPQPPRRPGPSPPTALRLTAAIWHNHLTGQPVARSLTAYDH
jgi:hypothetical protein